MAKTYTPSTAAIASVRASISQEDSSECSDEMISRFLRADKGNVSAVKSRVTETLAWRRNVKPEQVVCKHCLHNPRSHYFHPVGYHKDGYPVLYSCNALASDRSLEGNKSHMILTFEQAIRLMPEGVEKWVWFADFSGFGLRDCGVGVAKAFLELASKHYPERLAQFLIVGPPAIFKGLCNAILPFVDTVTKAKIHILPYDVEKPEGALHTFLMDNFTVDTIEWLVREMAENRISSLTNQKVYCQKTLYRSITSGGQMERHWGSNSMLNKLVEEPEHLQPQATAAV